MPFGFYGSTLHHQEPLPVADPDRAIGITSMALHEISLVTITV